MYQTFKKICLFLPALILIFQSQITFVYASNGSEIKDDFDSAVEFYSNNIENQDAEIFQTDQEPSPEDFPGFEDPQKDISPVDPSINALRQSYYDALEDGYGTVEQNPSSTASRMYANVKIEINSSDRRDIEKYTLLSSLVPNLELPWILAEYSSLSEEELGIIKFEDPERYKSIIDEMDDKFGDSYIKEQLFGKEGAIGVRGADILPKLLGYSEEYIIDQLNSPSGKKEIESAVDKILATKIDRRVIETLNYLVRPKDHPDGGAGHWHIKVSRIRKNYTRENSKHSRESKEAERKAKEIEEAKNQNLEDYKSKKSNKELKDLKNAAGLDDSDTLAEIETEGPEGNNLLIAIPYESKANISAHYRGQAFDISEVDDIKCTLIKRKRAKSNTLRPQRPQDIKLLWQTNEGFGKDAAALDSSYNDMFMRMSRDSLISLFAELNIDFENIDDLEGASFSDIAEIIGQSLFVQAINGGIDGIWKFNLSDTLRKLGGVVLADNLLLNRAPFLDLNIDSIDELSEAIGRNEVEAKLNLPYGALKGSNRDEILANIGKIRLADELMLPHDVLNYDITSPQDLYQRIGSRMVETAYGFPKESFYNKANLSELEKSLGKYRLQAFLSEPEFIDQEFELMDGTTRKLKTAQITPLQFNRLVAEAHIAYTVYIYQNYHHAAGAENTVTAVGETLSFSNWRDEMFNFPEGTVDRFTRGELTVDDFKSIGINTLAKTLEQNDTSRNNLEQWLNSPNSQFTILKSTDDGFKTIALPKSKYAQAMSVQSDDVYRIFGTDRENSARGVFKRLGEKTLTQALKDSPLVERKQKRYLNDHPEIAEKIETFEFYKSRVDIIKSRKDSLAQKINDLLTIVSDPSYALGEQLIDENRASLYRLSSLSNLADETNNIVSFVALGRDILESSDEARVNLDRMSSSISKERSGIKQKINAINYDIEIIARSAYEIVTGEEQPDFRLEDTKIDNISSNKIDLGGMSLGTIELTLLFSGQISIKEFFMSVASAKIANEINIPPMALKYAAMTIEYLAPGQSDLKDSFFRAVGMAELERNGKVGNGPMVKKEKLGGSLSAVQLRDEIQQNGNMSRVRANEILANSLNLDGFNLEHLMRGNFAAWSLARKKAEENDNYYGLKIGTTEAFVKGEPYGNIDSSLISDDELRRASTALGVSEAALKTFIAVREGQENPSINKIYYVDRNRYRNYQDSEGICQPKLIPDNVFIYFDADGEHFFQSFPEANEYVKAHKDRQLNYKEEIITSLKKLFQPSESTYRVEYNFSNLEKDIDSFLAGSRQSVFPTGPLTWGDAVGIDAGTYASQKTMFLDANLFNRIFTRNSSSSSGGKPPIDFLKIYGYNLLKEFASSYISDMIGLDIGSERITPDDIFEIFNGNTRSVFARIGGSVLDNELGLEKGTSQTIIDAKNPDQRKCALERAAASLLGNAIGIEGLDIDGSMFDNFGGKKIENFLGFPERSFRGEKAEDLLNHVPVYDFLRAFALPVAGDTYRIADEALQVIGDDFYKRYKNDKSADPYRQQDIFYQQLDVIIPYIQALGIGSDSIPENPSGEENESQYINRIRLEAVWASLMNQLNIDARGILKLFKSTPQITFPQTEQRLRYIDFAMALDLGTTKNLLLDKISPNQYRKRVSDRAIEGIGLEILLSALDLDDKDITLGDLYIFKANVKNSNLAGIYDFLDKLFSVNLDKKAGFAPGTFSQIIRQPNNARPLMMLEGGRRLDEQLNLRDKYGISFEKFVSIYLDERGEWVDTCGDPTRPTYAECMNEHRMAYERSTFGGTHSVSDLAKEALSVASAVVIANEIAEFSGVKIEITDVDLLGRERKHETTRHGIRFTSDQILGIFKGDFRPLMIIGMARGMKEVIGDEDGRYAVQDDYLIFADDLIYAFYGDVDAENYARERARLSTLATLNGTFNGDDFLLPEERTNSPDLPVPYSYAAGPLAITRPTTSIDHAMDTIDELYPISEGANVSELSEPGAPRPTEPNWEDYDSEDYGDDSIRMYDIALVNYWKEKDDWEKYDANIELVNRSQAEATAQVDNIFREVLKYKMMDCALYKIDSNIPPGFAWAMMKGNGYLKTSSLLHYIENTLRHNGSDWLPEGTLNSFYDFFYGPPGVKGDIGIIVSGPVAGTIDRFLINNTPTLLGLGIQPGTTASLLAFSKTGDWTQDYGSIPSLKKLYGENWLAGHLCSFVDEKIGLAPGTSFQVYSLYKDFRAAQGAAKIYNTGLTFTSGEFVGELNIGIHNAVLPQYDAYRSAMTNAGKDPMTMDDWFAKQKDAANTKINQVKAAVVTFIITTVFSKQLIKIDQSLGLVPGSMAMVVGNMVSTFFGVLEPTTALISTLIFIGMNLFGVYKVDLYCTADGNYPKLDPTPNPNRWDVAGLGNFDGMNPNIREEKFIEAAQYKANRLIGDLYMMAAITGDESLVPTQIMTGRIEDVESWKYLVPCHKHGSSTGGNNYDGICPGTNVGVWQNPQTTAYTHVGF